MSSQSKNSILIVEDDFIVAKVIEKNLLDLGYAVAGMAATGEEAVAKAGGLHPDLVLMDIRLQGPMDGITAADQIQTMYDIPVVFLTAFSDKQTFDRALITHPYGYIVKPFSQNTLSATIQVALTKKQADQRMSRLNFWLDKTVGLLAEGIITVDAEGMVILVNHAAELMTGWTNREAYKHPLDAVLVFRDPIGGKSFHYNIKPILAEGVIGTIPDNSSVVSKKEVDHIIEESFASPIRNKRGRITGAVIVLYPKILAPESETAETERGSAVQEVSIAYDKREPSPGPTAPIDAEGWYDRGNSLLIMRRYEEAVSAYQNAVSMNPMNYQSWFGLATALDKVGKVQEALDAYERALSIYPRNPRILDAKGILLKKIGDDAEAERCFELATLYAA
jgi:CheY-like chemotaxis protein